MSSVPEISYANTSPDEVQAGIISAIETGLGRKLYPGDPLRLFALAFAAEDVQIRNLIDEAGRQNLLAYATGDNLDALGDLIGVTRLPAQKAVVTLRFSAASALVNAVTIPAGTRATPDGSLYFATDMAATIPAGGTYADVTATCITEGTAGNGFLSGEIDQIVDVVAFVPTVSNITASSGGADEEGDEAYRNRIRLGVTALSVAGSRDAYEYWARTASALVSDVHIDSPSPGEVDVYILLTGGVLPDSAMLASVEAILSADTVRPLTDLVTAKAPTTTEYTVEITYYIRQADAVRAAEIQTAVEAAVADWILWQRNAIGRDINPSELTARMVNAGAKRVAITTPAYTAIAETAIAVISGDATIVYGGLEDE